MGLAGDLSAVTHLTPMSRMPHLPRAPRGEKGSRPNEAALTTFKSDFPATFGYLHQVHKNLPSPDSVLLHLTGTRQIVCAVFQFTEERCIR